MKSRMKKFLIQYNIEIVIFTITILILPLILKTNFHKLAKIVLVIFNFYISYIVYVSYINNINKKENLFYEKTK